MTDFHLRVLDAIDETPRTMPEICKRVFGYPIAGMRPVATAVTGLVLNGKIARTQFGMQYRYHRNMKTRKAQACRVSQQ